MLRLRIFIGLIVGLIFCQALQGQLPRYKQWENIYGTAKNDIASRLHDLGDGNYAASGWVDPDNRQPDYGHWFTFAPNGDELKSGLGSVWKMSTTLSGGLIFGFDAKCQQNQEQYFTDIKLVSTNDSGDIAWSRCLGSEGNEVLINMFNLSNGHVLIFGMNSHNDLSGDYKENYGGRDVWVVMLNDSGDIIWEQNYGGSGDDMLHACSKFGDKYVMLIRSDSEDYDFLGSHAETKYGLLTIDESGVIHSKAFTYNNIVVRTYRNDFVILNDSILVMSGNIYGSSNTLPGHHNPPGDYGSDASISKINFINGEVQFAKLFGGEGYDMFERIQQKSNGNLVLGGTTRSFDGDLSGRQPEDSEVWLVEMDTAGNIIDQFFPDMGGSGGGYIDFLLNEQDEIILLSENNNKDAFPEHYGQFDHELPRDYYIFKLGYTPVGITENTISTGFTLYPNPNSTGLLHSSQKGNYILRDLQGRRIKEFYNSKSLDLSQIQSGTYIVQDQNGASQRVVLQ